MPKLKKKKAKPLPKKLPRLSRREMEVLTWTACGKTNWEIAEKLKLSEETIRTYIKKTCKKFGTQNKTQAVTIALVYGIIKFRPRKRLMPLPVVFGLAKK